LDKTAVRELAKQYVHEVRKFLQPQSIILFGSYVNGNPHEYSDVDIAVVFDGFDGDWLETSTYLAGIAWDMNCDIEPHLMDLSNDRSGFLQHIQQTGEVIYSA